MHIAVFSSQRLRISHSSPEICSSTGEKLFLFLTTSDRKKIATPSSRSFIHPLLHSAQTFLVTTLEAALGSPFVVQPFSSNIAGSKSRVSRSMALASHLGNACSLLPERFLLQNTQFGSRGILGKETVIGEAPQCFLCFQSQFSEIVANEVNQVSSSIHQNYLAGLINRSEEIRASFGKRKLPGWLYGERQTVDER